MQRAGALGMISFIHDKYVGKEWALYDPDSNEIVTVEARPFYFNTIHFSEKRRCDLYGDAVVGELMEKLDLILLGEV